MTSKNKKSQRIEEEDVYSDFADLATYDTVDPYAHVLSVYVPVSVSDMMSAVRSSLGAVYTDLCGAAC